MQYDELSIEELVILAVEFIAMGKEVPLSIRTILGPALMQDLLPVERGS